MFDIIASPNKLNDVSILRGAITIIALISGNWGIINILLGLISKILFIKDQKKNYLASLRLKQGIIAVLIAVILFLLPRP